MTTARTRPCEAEAIRSARGAACTVRQQRWVLAATILASTIAYVDESVVNVALPAIGRDLAASPAALQWVINAYTLCLAAFLLVGGAAGDRLGRRRIFIAGVALFGLASLGCGLSRDTRAADRRAGGCRASARRCSFPVRWPSSARPFPRANAAAPSAPGRASPPSPPPSARCWAAGSSITCPGRRSFSSTRCSASPPSGSPGAVCRKASIPRRRPASTGRAHCWPSPAWPAWPSA